MHRKQNGKLEPLFYFTYNIGNKDMHCAGLGRLVLSGKRLLWSFGLRNSHSNARYLFGVNLYGLGILDLEQLFF